MNRFVLIGNGFDLAHGLKTSYSDFICWYLKKHLIKAINSPNIEQGDSLITFKALNYLKLTHDDFLKLKEDALKAVENSSFDELMRSRYIDWNLDNEIDTSSNFGNEESKIQATYKSVFFKELFKEQKWTDVERFYFEFLLKKFNNSKTKVFNKGSGSIRDLGFIKSFEKFNREFDKLKSELTQYISEIDSNIEEINPLSTLQGLIERLIQEPEVDYLSRFIKITVPNHNAFTLVDTTFINFNYTSLLGEYLIGKKVNHIQIHGSCKFPEKVIFGYGDDTHKDYQSLEDAEINELMEHMKPFYYPSSKEYIDLINSLDNDDFEVCVVGHSLGLSDRVLLKTIFEHKNCMAIRLFHRGDESRQVTQRINLSRHFSDKQAMRRKMVEFDIRDVIPQTNVSSHTKKVSIENLNNN